MAEFIFCQYQAKFMLLRRYQEIWYPIVYWAVVPDQVFTTPTGNFLLSFPQGYVAMTFCNGGLHCGLCQNDNGTTCEQVCLKEDNGTFCGCFSGYELAGKSCVDINECEEIPNVCPSKTTCHNYRGTYKCIDDQCNKYGHLCQFYCTNTVLGWNCTCPEGYRTSSISWTLCEVVDECASLEVMNGCGNNSFCTRSAGSTYSYCSYMVSMEDSHLPPLPPIQIDRYQRRFEMGFDFKISHFFLYKNRLLLITEWGNFELVRTICYYYSPEGDIFHNVSSSEQFVTSKVSGATLNDKLIVIMWENFTVTFYKFVGPGCEWVYYTELYVGFNILSNIGPIKPTLALIGEMFIVSVPTVNSSPQYQTHVFACYSKKDYVFIQRLDGKAYTSLDGLWSLLVWGEDDSYETGGQEFDLLDSMDGNSSVPLIDRDKNLKFYSFSRTKLTYFLQRTLKIFVHDLVYSEKFLVVYNAHENYLSIYNVQEISLAFVKRVVLDFKVRSLNFYGTVVVLLHEGTPTISAYNCETLLFLPSLRLPNLSDQSFLLLQVNVLSKRFLVFASDTTQGMHYGTLLYSFFVGCYYPYFHDNDCNRTCFEELSQSEELWYYKTCSPHSIQPQCPTGYTMIVNGKCTDIDECSPETEPPVCSHYCTNYPGTYTCACHEGYLLFTDRHSCIQEVQLNKSTILSPIQGSHLFGYHTEIFLEKLFISDPYLDKGVIYVFRKDGVGDWKLESTVIPPSEMDVQMFGYFFQVNPFKLAVGISMNS
eukprot:TRINITY_DN9632_c0_g1_i14.p1 TRINITY_DN9632_c0_g1~~TRINITY_DN9632_c0_g1_i14.p1  ORF type:complete len:760 (+),score=93.80 TRINITY_DN9632_c0_g1_i14:4527-6806(+)